MVMTSIDDVLSDYDLIYYVFTYVLSDFFTIDYVLIDCVLVNYVFTYVLSDDFLL